MAVSVKLLRSLGYLKITDLESDIALMTVLNNQLCDINIKSWSVPDKYQECGGQVGYEAIQKLLENRAEVRLDTEVTNVQRRSFKNTWALLWKNYCEAMSYPDNICVILSELGIRLAFVNKDDRSTLVAKAFFNDIINWFLYTGGDSVDSDKVLRTLVVGDIGDLRRLYGYYNN